MKRKKYMGPLGAKEYPSMQALEGLVSKPNTTPQIRSCKSYVPSYAHMMSKEIASSLLVKV